MVTARWIAHLLQCDLREAILKLFYLLAILIPGVSISGMPEGSITLGVDFSYSKVVNLHELFKQNFEYTPIWNT